jgi:integrase
VGWRPCGLRRRRLPDRQEGLCHAVPQGWALAPGRARRARAPDSRRGPLGGQESPWQSRNGADPIAERKAARDVRTFKAVASDFLDQHVRAKRKGRTADEYERILTKHVNPAFGSKRIVDLRRADIAKLHNKLSASPYQANRAAALVSAVWNWAARRDEVPFADNPARAIERFTEKGRERFLTREELARLGDVLREGETIGLPYAVDETKAKARNAPKPESRRVKLDPFAVVAIRLLILTGARLREILDAQWSQLDLERGVLFLRDSKTGRKPVYLSAAAQSVLAETPRIKDNPHIIAGTGKAARADLNRPWNAVRKAANLDGLRIHDLRHSFASFGAGASLGLPIIGKLLGHSQPGTTARYAHLDADPVRRAAETIGATINAAMTRKSTAQVTVLRNGEVA